jgi:hypothetical protein
MKSVLDNSLVGLALLASAGYAVSSLGPGALRRRRVGGFAALLARAPAFLGLRRIARRFAAAATGGAHGACGGCGSCGSEQSPNVEAPAQDVRIPLTKIGRRP